MKTKDQPIGAGVRGLFETHLQVANLERSMQFYAGVLGFHLGQFETERRAAFYWIGEPGRSMLGLWENPPWNPKTYAVNEIAIQHCAFETDLAALHHAIAALRRQGIEVRNFYDEVTDTPSVFGWIPAASIYFNDPDGHLLEIIAKLPGVAKPEVGVISLIDWNLAQRQG